jgi:hypothetical protein
MLPSIGSRICEKNWKDYDEDLPGFENPAGLWY